MPAPKQQGEFVSAPSAISFEDVWATASEVKGWLTKDQATLLWNQAHELGENCVVLEIGSHHGRSTVVLAAAVATRAGKIIAVDPFVEGPLFGGKATRASFEENLRRASLRDRVDLIANYSTRLRPSWSREIDMLYIDGKHDFWTASDDLRWRTHLPSGGTVLVHDAFSSIGVTLALLVRVLPSSDLVYEGRTGSLAKFRVGQPTPTDRLRLVNELPWWLRNVGIKVLLRLRLRRVAASLGHSGPYDPY